MKKNRILIAIIIVLTSIATVYPQSLKSIFNKNDLGLLQSKADTNESIYSIKTSFVYALKHPEDITNEKGFAIDFQIDQTKYVSWLLGVNMSFYKRYYVKETYNVSTFRSLIGPKFYFDKDKLSTYFRISVGMTYFGKHTEGGRRWTFSMFPAFGLEYLISKNFKIYFEPNLNLHVGGAESLGIEGQFLFNLGIITKLK